MVEVFWVLASNVRWFQVQVEVRCRAAMDSQEYVSFLNIILLQLSSIPKQLTILHFMEEAESDISQEHSDCPMVLEPLLLDPEEKGVFETCRRD